MSEFTKGKWICYLPSENDIRGGLKDCNIFSVQGHIGHFIGTISTKEDARLIAAAPELYDIVHTLAECQPHQFSSLKLRANQLINSLEE